MIIRLSMMADWGGLREKKCGYGKAFARLHLPKRKTPTIGQ